MNAEDEGSVEAKNEESVEVAADDGTSSVPEWDDEYLDRVADRLKFTFDLERDRRVEGQRFDLYGQMVIESQKQFFHPALNYAHQQTREHLLVRRVGRVSVADLERVVETGHVLGDEWIDADEEHQGTEFTFVLVADDVPDDVREFVEGFRDRTLIKYGYYGHYELNLVVVAPETESYAASPKADVWRAFAPWADSNPDPKPGLVARLRGLLK